MGHVQWRLTRSRQAATFQEPITFKSKVTLGYYFSTSPLYCLHPSCVLRFFLFRSITNHAFAGAGSPEVCGDGNGLVLPDPLCHMLRFFLFRAATSHAFAVSGSPEVNGFGLHCGPTKLGDGWSSDGMLCGCAYKKCVS